LPFAPSGRTEAELTGPIPRGQWRLSAVFTRTRAGCNLEGSDGPPGSPRRRAVSARRPMSEAAYALAVCCRRDEQPTGSQPESSPEATVDETSPTTSGLVGAVRRRGHRKKPCASDMSRRTGAVQPPVVSQFSAWSLLRPPAPVAARLTGWARVHCPGGDASIETGPGSAITTWRVARSRAKSGSSSEPSLGSTSPSA
jgi:hypothetical protein